MNKSRLDFTPLDANYANISDVGSYQIDGTIEAIEADIRQIDEEISRLTAQRTAHLKHVDRLRAAKSPCRRMPPELLSRVLLASIEHDSDIEPIDDTGLFTLPYMKLYVPWVARQVCTRWRAVSLSEARLWDRVRLCLPPSSPNWPTSGYHAWLCLLDRVLDLLGTANRPVCLYLQLAQEKKPSTGIPDYLNLITHSLRTELFGRFGNRVRSCELSCDASAFIPLFQSPPWTLPSSLYTFSLIYPKNKVHLVFGTDQEDASFLSTGLGELRILQGGSRQKLPFDRIFFRSLPWAQLKNLVLDYPLSRRSTIYSLLSTLRQCSSLISACLRIFSYERAPFPAYQSTSYDSDSLSESDSEEESEDDPDAIRQFIGGTAVECVLPNLESLKLSLSHTFGRGILGHLTLPKLSFLSITHENYNTDYPEFLTNIEDLIRRSHCQLRAFIENPNPSSSGSYPGSARDGFMSAIGPSLEELHTCILLNDSTLQQIASGNLFPNLRCFKFCTESASPYETLEVLKDRFGWLNPKLYAYSGLRKVRMVHLDEWVPKPVVSMGEHEEAIYINRWEVERPGLELHIGPKVFKHWSDTRI